MVLALAFTESSLNYNVKHKGNRAIGVCGIIPVFHKKILSEYKVKINSLRACEVVYNYYLELNNGDKLKALIDYKGIENKKNLYLAKRVLKLENEIKQKGIKWEKEDYTI